MRSMVAGRATGQVPGLRSGVASRRAAEELIRAGRVTVDGETRARSRPRRRASEALSLDGAPWPSSPSVVVYAVNKPAGVVSTARDPQGRPTVVSLVPSELRLYPVGRLDIDTTGLILLTNDGELAHRLTHPGFEVEKTYRAVVGGAPVAERALTSAPGRGRARRWPDRAGPREPGRRRHARAHDPRGTQAPGQADVRAGRPSGQAAAAHPLRPARARRAIARATTAASRATRSSGSWPLDQQLVVAQRRRASAHARHQLCVSVTGLVARPGA